MEPFWCHGTDRHDTPSATYFRVDYEIRIIFVKSDGFQKAERLKFWYTNECLSNYILVSKHMYHRY